MAHSDTCVFAKAALCLEDNMPDSHEFVDVSEVSEDAAMNSDCE